MTIASKRDPEELTRRTLMKAAAAIVLEHWVTARAGAFGDRGDPGAQKVVLVTCGGMRRQDTFGPDGLANIPRLSNDLLPESVFYSAVQNRGVTSHYNTISSILTGNWQRLDDWGKLRPESPTIFEYLRRRAKVGPEGVWLISSNKALTSRIGASSVRQFGPAFGANVIFPKQLLINAVVRAAAEGRAVHGGNRGAVAPDLIAMLNADNYDGLGWSIAGDDSTLDMPTFGVMQRAIDDLIRTNAPVTGDEFTFLVASEVMKRFSPSFLTITFSDMEVAHFGAYSLYLAGIRNTDRLVYELWRLLQDLPAYKGKTTLLILPEFGRDMDGSVTNGFFNHRQNSDSTRVTWMVCCGEAVQKAQTIDMPVDQTDICATIARMFDLRNVNVPGRPIPGLWL